MAREGSYVKHPQGICDPDGNFPDSKERGSTWAQCVELVDAAGNPIGSTSNPFEISNPQIKDVQSFSGSVGTTASSLSIPPNCIAIEIQNTHSSNDLYVGDSGVADDGSGGGKKIFSNSNPHSIDNISGSDLNGNLYVVGSAASTTYIGNYYIKS